MLRGLFALPGSAAANRSARTVTLTVVVIGHGKVVSSSKRISCSTTCTSRVARGASVRLVGQPTSGYRFRGWTGACRLVARACVIKLRTAQRVKATFVRSAVPPPAPVSGANLWVDTNGGSCGRAAKGGNYADSQACGSFQAAYGAAQCGDVVGVRPGSYSSQTISSKKACSASTQVTFTSVPGAACDDNTAVSMPSFSISGNYVKLHCINANPSGTNRCADVSGSGHSSVIFITLDRVSLHCGFFDSDHLRVTNSTFGPDDVCQTRQEDMVVFRANSSSIDDVVFDH